MPMNLKKGGKESERVVGIPPSPCSVCGVLISNITFLVNKYFFLNEILILPGVAG